MNHRSPIRIVAWIEATKGIAVLLAASGLLSLWHQDLHEWAVALVEHTHLNPASHYPKIFIDAASNLNDARLLVLAAGAFLYASMRLVEAYGLLRSRAWAEVLAAGSGAVYVPFELMELYRQPTVHTALLLAVNVGVVALMLRALYKRRAVADPMSNVQFKREDER